MEINALVEEKIAADADFQASLAEIQDDTAREEALAAKRSEVLSNEFAALTEKAAKAEKAEEIAANQKKRAEIAEAKAKALEGAGGAGDDKATALSASDIVALSKVHEDDIERVERFAKSEGISIKEALQNKELKAILSVRGEERDSAAAANTAPVRGGKAAVSGDALLEKASKGDLPDSDDQIEKLMKAKMGKR